MNKLILIGIFMLSTSLFSQSVFFTTGKNYTDYDFTTSEKNQDSEFASGSGNFYEVGYTRSINRNNTFRYSISINLNEYNSYGGDLATSYAWETDYIGLKIRALRFYDEEMRDYPHIRSYDSVENLSKFIDVGA